MADLAGRAGPGSKAEHRRHKPIAHGAFLDDARPAGRPGGRPRSRHGASDPMDLPGWVAGVPTVAGDRPRKRRRSWNPAKTIPHPDRSGARAF